MCDDDGASSRAAVERHVSVGTAEGVTSVRSGTSKIRIQFDAPVSSPCFPSGDRSGRETSPFCDRHIRKVVTLLASSANPQKGEENDHAEDDEPTGRLNANDVGRMRLPYNRRDLIDGGIIGMGTVSAHVRIQGSRGQVEIDGYACQRSGAEDVDASETHETEVPTGTHAPIGSKELLELRSSDGEFTNGSDCKMRLEQHHNTS